MSYVTQGNYQGQNQPTQTGAYNVPRDVEAESGSPIRDSVTANEQILSELHTTIDQLEKRLDTVLMPTPPTGAGTSAQPPQPVTSHIRGRLLILNEGYVHATERLRGIMRRVEV